MLHIPARPKTFLITLFLMMYAGLLFAQTDTGLPSNTTASFPPLINTIRFDDTIAFCGKKIKISNPQIRARLEKEMLLAIWDRPQVILWMKRSGKYFSHIETILNQYNLPMDFKYVPVVESALRPHSGSSKGAVGFWQFVRGTGRRYGLKINSRVDERRNLFASTDAAAKYLRDLKKQFKSDFLALAAYNMGEYGLKAEIDSQKNSDFFSLYLPIETQRYVFKLISTKLILEQPAKYGFHLEKKDIYPVFAFDRVKFKAAIQIPILLVAQAADTSFKRIKDMNPELRGYYLSKGAARILIPKGQASIFKDRFERLYGQWKREHEAPRVHVVKRGESLTAIAKKYNLTLAVLLKLNNLKLKKVIHPGDRLLVK